MYLKRMQLGKQLVEIARDIDDRIFENVGPMKILFVMTDGYGFACQTPVIRELLHCDGVVVRVVNAGAKDVRDVVFGNAIDRKLFLKLSIGLCVAAIRKWHVVVYSHMCSFYTRRHALRAYMHHGAGFGSGGGTGAAESCDLYFGLSNAERAYLDERHPGLFERDRAFFPIGFPRSDWLVNVEFDRERIYKEHGLPVRKTILIASSRNPGNLLATHSDQLFRRVADAFPDWTVIQTGHPWLWTKRSGVEERRQTQLVDSLRQVESDYTNARFLPTIPADRLAVISDLLVADGTSVVTMFGLLDRPIVYFDNPQRSEESKRSWAHYREAGEVFTSADEVVEACRKAIADLNEGVRSARRRLKELFYANPGRASKAAASTLRDIGCVCSTRSRKWQGVLALSNPC